MDETMNTASETAISQESETQQETANVNETDTQPQVQDNGESTTAQPPEEQTAATGAAETNETFLEIKYFGENIGLSKDEAKNFAEIGRRYSDVRDTLERVATLKGQSVEDFLKGIETAEDEAYRKGLVDKFGEDEDTINKMMELYTINKEKTLTTAKESRRQAAEQAEQSINARIAEEFQGMKAEFPELSEFSALPDEVKKAALNGMPLEYAYLKHMRHEQNKINAAKESEAEAAKKSTGALGSADKNAQSDVESAFSSGFWGRN